MYVHILVYNYDAKYVVMYIWMFLHYKYQRLRERSSPDLPADSPVLIQSGLAMLAMAKMSAARNRHPDMMVNLSIAWCWLSGSSNDGRRFALRGYTSSLKVEKINNTLKH